MWRVFESKEMEHSVPPEAFKESGPSVVEPSNEATGSLEQVQVLQRGGDDLKEAPVMTPVAEETDHYESSVSQRTEMLLL